MATFAEAWIVLEVNTPATGQPPQLPQNTRSLSRSHYRTNLCEQAALRVRESSIPSIFGVVTSVNRKSIDL